MTFVKVVKKIFDLKVAKRGRKKKEGLLLDLLSLNVIQLTHFQKLLLLKCKVLSGCLFEEDNFLRVC